MTVSDVPTHESTLIIEPYDPWDHAFQHGIRATPPNAPCPDCSKRGSAAPLIEGLVDVYVLGGLVGLVYVCRCPKCQQVWTMFEERSE